MLSINKESFKRDYKKKFLELHGIELEEGKIFISMRLLDV